MRIYPYPNIAFGRPIRFAFSLEVLQHGKRLGGMSSGAGMDEPVRPAEMFPATSKAQILYA